MQVPLIFALVTILLSGTINGHDQNWNSQVKPFKQLCEGREIAGFAWQNDAWVKSDFKKERFILISVDPLGTSEDNLSEDQQCQVDIEHVQEDIESYEEWQETIKKKAAIHDPGGPLSNVGGFIKQYPICVKKQVPGESSSKLFSCYENHYISGTGESRVHFVCIVQIAPYPGSSIRTLAFELDGWFHLSDIHANLENTSNYKKPLEISVGTCNSLE